MELKMANDPLPSPGRSSSPTRFRADVAIIPQLRHSAHSGTFICQGRGLRHCKGDGSSEHGYVFDADVRDHLPQLEQEKTETEGERLFQPKMKECMKSLEYWQAQCVFRKLRCTGTIEDLQDRIGKYWFLGMDDDVADLEKKLNEEYWEKNALTQKEMWDSLETQEEKLHANPFWCLTEAFSEPGLDVLTLKVREMYYDRYMVESAAASLKLCHKSGLAPPEDNTFMRWVMFGTSISSVTAQIRKQCTEMVREVDISLQSKSKPESTRRILHGTAVTEMTNSDAYWDVGGLWTISFPFIESEAWGLTRRSRRCSLDIKFPQNRRLGCQMWAKFNFIGIKGVLGFLTPKLHSGYEDESSQVKYGVEDFYFKDFQDWPPQACPFAEYLWRGQDTFSGKFLLGKRTCWIDFRGMDRKELEGWFESDRTGLIQFTGRKSGQSPRSRLDEWEFIHPKWEQQETESLN